MVSIAWYESGRGLDVKTDFDSREFTLAGRQARKHTYSECSARKVHLAGYEIQRRAPAPGWVGD